MTAPPDTTAWPPREAVTATHGPALLAWAADTAPDRTRVCLIRGARGSGKSQLLAWFLAGAPSHPRTTAHATVLSAGLFTDAFAWELGRQLGYGPLAPHRLLDRIAADARPLLLLVPDLHRAGRGPADLPAARPRTIVDELLVPLLQLPYVRAAVEVGESDLLGTWPGAESLTTGSTSHGPYETDAPSDEVPRASDGRPRWDLAPPRAAEHALDQALLEPDPVQAVRTLITDPAFLVHGSAVAIAATLADERILTPRGLRETWRQAAPQLSDTEHSLTQRAALLHTAALGSSPNLAQYLRPLAEQHRFTAAWSRPDHPVTALARTPDALLTAGPLGDLTLLDPTTGAHTGTQTAPTPVRPQAIAVRQDGSALHLADTGALHPVAGETGASAAVERIALHHGQAALKDPRLRPTALGQCPLTGTTVVGDEQGNAHVWGPDAAQSTPHSHALHASPITAVTCLPPTPDAPDVLVFSAAMDGTVRLWATAADPLPEPVEQRPAFVTAMSAAHTPQGLVLAVAWTDARVHLWQVNTGRVHAIPLLTPCHALALTTTPTGDCHLVVAGPEGTYALRLNTTSLWT
ncbi:WD40 repeat domain-containing protein [Streptomyces sp. NBC_01465]|uniref:WD40 repeat domain-containing protein n=1 Tax=Streptomyces sp. NBC_01465 TaxID=2903878 RepID=UPI002E33A369|nr:WD40 repeat domain-containing protein [Streptomyces sp. NBC_01465]